MKKVININFHSRVIPIEESAYDILKQYVEKLRRHFASEEGGDEIVNDIENRFAELFSDKLKKGAVCITDEDVNAIIISMGNPEEFDQEENSYGNQSKTAQQQEPVFTEATEPESRSLYRSGNDKILGGVCAGLAAYFKMDPSIVRILYAFLTLGSFGFGLLLYIIFWAVLPVKSLTTHVRKKLYRNPDQRVIGGVASGLAAYLHIDVWIPRLIFALPFILTLISTLFHHMWFVWGGDSRVFTGGFGGSLLVAYVILWMLVPEASTASEKLEMRGEKIDIESIKNYFKSDLGGVKQRAAVIGGEIKQRAQEFSNEIKQKAPDIKTNFNNVRKSNGIAHAIGVLFRAFFLFIGIVTAFALIALLIGVIFSGATVMPLKNYFIHGFWQQLMAWAALLFVLCIPIIAILTWFVRRLIGARSKNNYLGYIFGSLWVIGLICFFILLARLTSNFRIRSGVGDDIALNNPRNGKLIVKVKDDRSDLFNQEWMGIHWDNNDAPFYNVNEDSIMLNTVRVDVVKSDDSAWHVHREKFSRGFSTEEAKMLAGQIDFDVNQQDSILYLSEGFGITPKEQFRNQQVLIVLQVPVGKKIFLDESADGYHWFNINVNRNHRRWSVQSDDWNDAHNWESGTEYVMTNSGLEKTGLHDSPERKEKIEKIEQQEKEEKQERKENEEDPNDGDKTKSPPAPKEDSGYRYHPGKRSAKVTAVETEERGGGSPFEIFTKQI